MDKQDILAATLFHFLLQMAPNFPSFCISTLPFLDVLGDPYEPTNLIVPGLGLMSFSSDKSTSEHFTITSFSWKVLPLACLEH